MSTKHDEADDVCGCCDRAPCVHTDEPTIEEIEADDAHRVAQLDAAWRRTWAAWPAAPYRKASDAHFSERTDSAAQTSNQRSRTNDQ